MNNSLREAFKSTQKGQNLIEQVNKERLQTKALKELAHTMIVEIGHNFPLYQKVKPFLKAIVKKGDDTQYQKATNALKLLFVMNKRCSYNQAENAVLESLGMPV